MSKIIPLYDRSRVVQDWKCPRSRFWAYEYGGKGISPISTAIELSMGITIHDGLATIAFLTQAGQDVNIDLLARTAYEQMYSQLVEGEEFNPLAVQFAKEQGTLVEGLLRGYYKHVWPRILAQYPKILFVEQEMKYEHDGLTFMSKPDLVLSTEDGEQVVYVEFKSTSSKREEWVNSWDTAIQLHSTVAAIKATTGVAVDAVIVQGLYKGYNSYGRQQSPMCYAYKRNGNPPFIKDELSYFYKAGFKASPVWELEGGAKAWVESMPEAVLTDQFPQTPPIFIKDDLVRSFFAQRSYREWAIYHALHTEDGAYSEPTEADLNDTFPQKFDQCVPSFGKPCPFRKLCHGFTQNPLEEGFAWREPHHSTEVEALAEGE